MNCAAHAVREYNKAIANKYGIENLITCIVPPTLRSAEEIFQHRGINLLVVTGGPAVARAALKSSKRAIVAGPGNPPVVVDETACLKNAAESIGENASDGEIHLSTGFRPGVRLSLPGAKTRVSLPLEFCVKDNGPGVPDDLMPHLFDPFVTTKPTGSGLGLALVAKIVGDHGGIIECETQPRRTIFRVLMPKFKG